MQKKNQTLRIALAQLNVCVGDVQANLQQVQAAIQHAQAQHADLIVFPELVLAGYPPEDLLFRPDFLAQMQTTVTSLAQNGNRTDVRAKARRPSSWIWPK